AMRRRPRTPGCSPWSKSKGMVKSGSGSAEERGAQGVQPDATDVERATVEGPEVEGCPLTSRRLLAHLQPEALADLVARRLPGPAEVAVELEAQGVLALVRVGGEEGPRLVVGPRAAADLGRCLEAAVHANVEHDPRRAQGLPVEQ